MTWQHFEDLTRGGQVRRLRRLAETALTDYDLGEVHLKPLKHLVNTTFRVDTCLKSSGASQEYSTAGKEERYVIRIYRPGSQDALTIQSELHWLQILRREAGLVVPEPIPTHDGASLTLASTARVPEPRLCVVFRWIDGCFLKSSLGVKELERVGVLMAKLHRCAQCFVVPKDFFRKRWDYEGLRSGALGTDLEQSWAHLSREERAILDAVAERVQQTMQTLGEGPEVFGLIHGDLFERNYLFSKGEVCAIDFDGCGWGYYLFDIGVTFSSLLARTDYPVLRQAFLEGYRRVRPLSVDHEALIDTFIAGRLMCNVLWFAAHMDEPSYAMRAVRIIKYALRELKSFLDQ